MTPIQSDIYDYVVFTENLSNGNSATLSLNIQSDADFECQSLESALVYNILAPALQEVPTGEHFPGITVLIENTGNGQRWSNNPVQVPALFGTGQNPFVLPVSMIMERNAAFKLTVENDSGFDVDRLTFVFSGRKLLS